MRLRAATIFAALLSACTVQDTVATQSITGDAGPDRNSYCQGTGPPILVGDNEGATDVCAGDLAEATFKFAMCTCDNYASSDALTVDAVGGGPGSVGTNGLFSANSTIDISGSLTVASVGGVQGGSTVDVLGDLAVGGPLGRPTTSVTVGGNAQVASNIELTDLSVAGTLTLPAEATITVSGTTSIGTEQRAPVAVAPPCACEPDDLVNIAGFVEAHRNVNHNADINLDVSALSDFEGDAFLDLPCGRYYLNRVQGDGALTIRISGRVALFIAENISMQDTLVVEVAPGGELDLFVAGLINTSNDVRFGSADTPEKVRLYVGGTGSINLTAQSTFAGNLYAPLLDLALSGSTEVFGSVFTRRVNTAGPLMLHYDPDIESAGDACIL